MVHTCFIVGCKRNALKNSGLSFHKIPSIIKETNRQFARPGGILTFQEKIDLSKKRREEWIRAINRGPLRESQIRNATICSRHFKSGRPADIFDLQNPDWVPCQNLFSRVGAASKKVSALDRQEIPKKRTKEEKKEVLIPPVEDEEIVIFDPSEEIPLFDPESEEIFYPDSEDIPFFDPHDYAMASVVAKEEDLDQDSPVIIEIPEKKEIEEPQLQEYEEIEEELEDEKMIPVKRNLKEETKGLQKEEVLQHCERILNNVERAKLNLKGEVSSLRKKLKRLEEIKDESKVLLRVKALFNEDQLLNLMRGENSKPLWTMETIEKALKLRLACGEAGYTELLRQNFPFPSTRSLKRVLKDSKLRQTYSEEFKYLKNEFGSDEKGKAEVLTTLRKKKGRKNCFDEFVES